MIVNTDAGPLWIIIYDDYNGYDNDIGDDATYNYCTINFVVFLDVIWEGNLVLTWVHSLMQSTWQILLSILLTNSKYALEIKQGKFI